MTSDDRLRKARAGETSREELRQAADELRFGAGRTDPYTLLYIIGKAEGGSAYRDLVEGFLNADDPMMVRLALEILCQWWDKATDYQETIMHLLRPNSWDREGQVRLMAISCAGTLLASQSNKAMLDALIPIARDAQEGESEREAAADAIAAAAGIDLPTWLSRSRSGDTSLDDAITLALNKQAPS